MDTMSLCRKAAAEGAVLLKNEHAVLPLATGTRLAVFGRAQTFYYKSGTGSGGLVHIDKEPCVLTSLKENDQLALDQSLVALYEAWVEEHPFDDGGGRWGGEPWHQEEMPLEDEVVKTAAQNNDVALIVLARTAGEDHDNADEEGGYRLTQTEERLLSQVSACFDRVIVALNVGNLIDTSFMNRYPITALLYIWQGGMAGADAFADLLSGKSAPSGRLTDTAAWSIADHPSHANFGDLHKNIYKEDIYLGYRYFETFDKQAVQYPFGYGLTYTTFEAEYTAVEQDDEILVTARVTNTGARAGREVAQVYYEAPCGLLGTPSRQLIAFAKTKELLPGESETLTMTVRCADMASYDDGGITGYRSAYVLECGNYTLYGGENVRAAQAFYTYSLETLTVVSQYSEVMAPSEAFERLCATEENGQREKGYRAVPLGTVDLEARIASRRPMDIPFTGDQGIRLQDVYHGKHTVEEFMSQLPDSDLAAMVCGEGMNSPKATPGTGGALGGQTENLSRFGIPVCCVTDGPSGIRLDDGTKASSIPSGTLLACTWDTALVEQVYARVGEELKEHHVDALLGPGINLHRHPLCGRNFEYFSEDPYLTGMIAAAVSNGVAVQGAYATIKHFCGNNQESNRYGCDTVVSERALRELYLKPFELAVKHGSNVLIMTAYNPVNGYWTASNYDLTSTVLRGEWGFENLVMTDWWANCNLACHSEGRGDLLQAMVRAENDVYMVCPDAQVKAQSVLDGLRDGYITRGELQRCVGNILRWILRCNTFKEYMDNGCQPKYPVTVSDEGMRTVAQLEAPCADTAYTVMSENGRAVVDIALRCDADGLAQVPVAVQVGVLNFTVSVCNTGGETVHIKRALTFEETASVAVSLSHLDSVVIERVEIKQ